MFDKLQADRTYFRQILAKAFDQATEFLAELERRPVAVRPERIPLRSLPDEGLGATGALDAFQAAYAAGLSASPGPRYFGFVTGGATPAALAGDWLVSTYDQNATGFGDSCAPLVELETIHLLRELLGLPPTFTGNFVSGATMANFVGLALARQWIGYQYGIDAAENGLSALPQFKVFAASPHSSLLKAMAMLGMGRSSLEHIPTLPGREAMDLAALEKRLTAMGNQPAIVLGSAGTVDTVDFDDLKVLGQLKALYTFWLHVDGAFGAFAACSPRYAHLVDGLELADSITVDAHKWLNVPYDSAMQFTRHHQIQPEIFLNTAPYLNQPAGSEPNFVHLTPENSRRFRALPAWLTLMAYGRHGYQEIVERNCDLAQSLGNGLDQSPHFQLLAPVRLNVVCFTLLINGQLATMEEVIAYLARLREEGQVFLTPSMFQGTPAIRAALCNWQTGPGDIELALRALKAAHPAA